VDSKCVHLNGTLFVEDIVCQMATTLSRVVKKCQIVINWVKRSNTDGQEMWVRSK
jgi:hypothetical protein